MYLEASFFAKASVLYKRDKKGGRMPWSGEALLVEFTTFVKGLNCKIEEKQKQKQKKLYVL